ncbi:copper transporter [Salinactinospora qingdaonensis]|uniref:Copper transporter n=1 Tax=Salinactinospora qingdaonensis TaxID=702744 RepID=A0ABP7F2T4_9ACTN
MIDFRYHLVSIIAVFLALTVGIVLGSTMLQDPVLNTLQAEADRLRDQAERLREEKDTAEQLNASANHVISSRADDMLHDRLADTRVVIVEAPGGAPELRNALATRLEQAGATVVGRLTLTGGYVDPQRADSVEELLDETVDAGDLPDGTTAKRAGAALARALVAAEDERDGGADTAAARESEALLEEFAEAGLLTVRGEPVRAADAVLVLAPAEPFAAATAPSPDAVSSPENTTLLELARALGAASEGMTLAGSPSSLETGGLVTQARTEGARFTTVDSAGGAAGNVVTVLALAASLAGHNGHYGIGGGADGFLPDPLPGPIASPSATSSPSAAPGGNG